MKHYSSREKNSVLNSNVITEAKNKNKVCSLHFTTIKGCLIDYLDVFLNNLKIFYGKNWDVIEEDKSMLVLFSAESATQVSYLFIFSMQAKK